jgi:NTE family protein
MKVKVCLSGGGTRGFAHLGVVAALQEANVEIAYISGTSSGAMAGAFLAAGYKPEEILKFFSNQTLLGLMNGAFSTGLFTMEKNVAKFFRKHLPEKFEDLKIKLWVNATDLLKGRTVFFNEGDLIIPLVGSSSIPGMFKPLRYQGYLLCDGGALNNLPIEPLLPFSEPLIAVHVNPVGRVAAPKSTWATLERSFQLSVYSNVCERKKLCPLIIEPPKLKNYKVFDYKKAEEIYKIGYEYTHAHVKDILFKIKAQSINL